MKKIFLCAFILLIAFEGMSQNADYRRPTALGFSLVYNDFRTPQLIRSSSIGTVRNNDQWTRLRDISPGLAFSYFKGLTNHVDFAGTVATSFSQRIPLPDSARTPATDRFLLETDASVNLKLMSDRYILTPYLNLGVGFSLYRGDFGAFLPLGVGFKVNFANDAALFINSQYRVPVLIETNAHHFFHSIGIAGRVSDRRQPVKTVVIPQAPTDTDGDGITDDVDKCPTVFGFARYDGCPIPDTDGDGINDEEDKCPTVFGFARYQGCPIPDTDGDGINDELDKCPNVPGVARYDGCPVPDTDGDGINDEEDRCPTVPGTRENFGCPEIQKEIIQRVEYAAKRIFFETAKFAVLAKSHASLDDVVKILKENPELKLSIEGHTDNVGSAEYNETLSDNRANSVKQYFISKGIDENRLTAQGFGLTQPLADNKTAAGRAQNRRVTMRVSY